MTQRRRGTAIVDTPNGILVVSEGSRTYYLPGGVAKKGESRRKAAIRELNEETGLIAVDCSYLFEYTSHSNRHKVFLMKCTGTAEPKNEIKHLAYFDGFNVNVSDTTRKIIERYQEGGLKSIFRGIKRSLKRIFREIKRSLTFWHEIPYSTRVDYILGDLDEENVRSGYPPRWVWKAYRRWKRRLPTGKTYHGIPFNMVKHFVGKHHIYKVVFGDLKEMGCTAEIRWYVKRRIRK